MHCLFYNVIISDKENKNTGIFVSNFSTMLQQYTYHEPRHEKTFFGVFDQVKLKTACSADETS